ncbi:MAG: porin family protein [Sphingomonas sp.]|nr:porin family protein [Sphingomonas sp.]
MRKLAISLALASTALATPALARDGSFYAGVEGGIMLVEDANIDRVDLVDSTSATAIDDMFIIKTKPGFDIDLIAGYDFGMVRVEGELGYKNASIDEFEFRNARPRSFGENFGADGDARAVSFMINALLDFGDEGSWSGYVGPGIGYAHVKYDLDEIDGINLAAEGINSTISDSRIAWQVVAGVRTALSLNLDLGLKYRFFNVPNLKTGDSDLGFDTRWRSHSLLLSLIYNFAAPPPPPVFVPPPPPPPPPATQTCPDGTVILATEMCPAPPPPPPPPPPAPERG